ncbi:hypothetical protein TRFO_37750 [Tritrichomonas foetus]|uniref:Uncharacterized protein n=1 Tax=Tritrichomonas foetus TaxID=1144522 RepID=A0A1J4JFW9_9EUKA|nr:hypothetical protein TRFO_37750 [Tritrichomonas foetus]|eukprot:OHS96108.1 hypothetical protein TRFO_37750 [Tritrichomonas foetus]
MENSKRNYIRRKKTYNKCMTLIRQTLELINLVKKTNIPANQITEQAKQHADLVEAVCWDPRTRITDELYQQVAIRKTRELCTSLINKQAPQVSAIHMIIQMNGLKSISALQNAPKDTKQKNISDTPKTQLKAQNQTQNNHQQNQQLNQSQTAPVKTLPIPILQNPDNILNETDFPQNPINLQFSINPSDQILPMDIDSELDSNLIDKPDSFLPVTSFYSNTFPEI